MATLTAYPDPDPETTTCDGWVRYLNGGGSGNGITWASLLAQTGNGFSDATEGQGPHAGWKTDTDTDKWDNLRRGIALFDTSSIGDTDTIDDATYSAFGDIKLDDSSNSPILNIYSSGPASNTGLTGTDHNTIGSTAYSSNITYSAFDENGYNDFVFNGTGEAAISKTGVTKTGTREVTYDVGATAPTWGSNNNTYFVIFAAETTGTTSDPKLVVNYTATATVTSILVNNSLYPIVN